MKKHLQYLWYVIRHKWFVFVECVKLGVPLLGIIHDWQKLTPSEYSPYMMTFSSGKWNYSERPKWLVDAFDMAWLHHQHLGPHHWQYWILKQDEDEDKVLPMPDKYRREMLADWIGAGRAINGKGNSTLKWYMSNRKKIQLHPETREWIDQKLGFLQEEQTE